ncbi:hypothetical protein BX616_003078, partial [Lobosporangium transversale]
HHAAQPATSSSVHIPMTPLQIDTTGHGSGPADIINGSLPSPDASSEDDFYEARDPMLLASKRMSEEQLRAIRSSKKVKEFYREQNELIEDLLEPPGGREGAQEEEEKNQLKLKIAVYGSFGVNVLLFMLQLYAAISSKSLALFATMADSFMDLLSGVILTYAARASTKSNWKYPSIESVRTLLENNQTPPMPSAIAIAFVGFALSNAIRQYNAANILATDHRNDLSVNGFGLFASLMSRYCWWLDPAGAIVVSLIILRSWVWTAYEQIQLIVGKSADPAFLKKLTYIALTHHRKILQVDTCTAYHAGNNFFVEVDVVMAPETPLWESHDISEGLQIKLESLPNVERAFVHVDYETSHAPEHRKLK